MNYRKLGKSLFSLIMVFAMVCNLIMPLNVFAQDDEDMYLCECCDEWKPESEICDDDTTLHCLECCEDGAAHCFICETFDPSKACSEEPNPHCTDCCEEKHCKGDCSPSEDTIGEHVCDDCGFCDECCEMNGIGNHYCDICGDCMLNGEKACDIADTSIGYHHESCCEGKHCNGCNKCEYDGVEICEECGYCDACVPDEEHFCKVCGICMVEGTRCDLGYDHCLDCCDDRELHCADCGEFDESTDCPDCEFCINCEGDNGSGEHFSEISGDCLNSEGSCSHGYAITVAECEEILCDDCGEHFGYECEACEYCVDAGEKRCTNCCESASTYDEENSLCENNPEYEEYVCPNCDKHQQDTPAGELCPDCGLCSECCLEQISSDTDTAKVCSDDFHCTHFCYEDNQCEEFCGSESICNATPCEHENLNGTYGTTASIHWQICADCGAKVNSEEHSFEWIDVDESANTAKQHCAVCGYTTEEKPYHEHVYGEWQAEYLEHVKRCTVEGCNHVVREPHSYSGNICTVCGHEKSDEIVITKEPETVYLRRDITAEELLDKLSLSIKAEYYAPLRYTWNVVNLGEYSGDYIIDGHKKYEGVNVSSSNFKLTSKYLEVVGEILTPTDAERLEIATVLLNKLKGADKTAGCDDKIEIEIQIRSSISGDTAYKSAIAHICFEHANLIVGSNDDVEHEFMCEECGQYLYAEKHTLDEFGRCTANGCGYIQSIKVKQQPRDIKQENNGARFYKFSVEAEGTALTYQWYKKVDGVITKMNNKVGKDLIVEVDPNTICGDDVETFYFCKIKNDVSSEETDYAQLIISHNYELKDYDGAHHAETCKYCGYVDPKSKDRKSDHSFTRAYEYGERRYDIVLDDSPRLWLTADLLDGENAHMQQAWIDGYCGAEPPVAIWNGQYNDSVPIHITAVCVDCGYVHEYDSTSDREGSVFETIEVSERNCSYYNWQNRHNTKAFYNDIIHWTGCSKCRYVEPESVSLHDVKPESSEILFEGGKYYRVDIGRCTGCDYTETTKTEITEQEANLKKDLIGTFAITGNYNGKIANETFSTRAVVRKHTIEDVPNDKRIFGQTLVFVDEFGKTTPGAIGFGIETPITSLIDGVEMEVNAVVGETTTDYEIAVIVRNDELKAQDFKVETMFLNLTTVFTRDGTLYTTKNDKADGEKVLSGESIELGSNKVAFFEAKEVTNPDKTLTGVSMINSRGLSEWSLSAEAVVPGEHDLYKLSTSELTTEIVEIKSNYEVNSSVKYTVGFDHDNDTVTPAIELPDGPFAQGTTLTVPLELKYYAEAPVGKQFSHWVCAQDGDGTIEYLPETIFTVVAENMIFTPVYNDVPAKMIAISYKDNLAGVVVDVPASVDIVEGRDYTISSQTPTATGYVFKGWTSAADVLPLGETSPKMYNPGDTVTIPRTRDYVVFNAVWQDASFAKAENNLLSVAQDTVIQGTDYTPVVSYTGGVPNGGEVELSYKLLSEDDGAYTTTKPMVAGNYTVKATSVATDTVLEKSVTANFNIIENTKLSQELNFAQKSVIKTYGDLAFTNSLNGTYQTITYSSDDTAVATVDSNTGEVTIVGFGIATITATSPEFTKEGEEYGAAITSFNLTVKKANVTITVEEKTVNVGADVPDISEFTYTVTGFVGTDAFITNPTLTYETTPNTQYTGSFAVDAIGATVDTSKYNLIVNDGALKVVDNIIVGNNQRITVGTNKDVVFKFDGNIIDFNGLIYENAPVALENYTVESGSIIITVKGEFVKTLPVGKHTFTAVVANDYITMSLFVDPVKVTVEPTAPQTQVKSPQTGDNSNVDIYLVLAIASLSALAFSVYKKETKEQTK